MKVNFLFMSSSSTNSSVVYDSSVSSVSMRIHCNRMLAKPSSGVIPHVCLETGESIACLLLQSFENLERKSFDYFILNLIAIWSELIQQC